MKKKAYKKPTMEVVIVERACQLLAGSDVQLDIMNDDNVIDDYDFLV